MEDWMLLLIVTCALFFLFGLGCGWLCWRLSMLHAEQRGREMEEDGLCVRGNRMVRCAAINEAARKAMQDMKR